MEAVTLRRARPDWLDRIGFMFVFIAHAELRRRAESKIPANAARRGDLVSARTRIVRPRRFLYGKAGCADQTDGADRCASGEVSQNGNGFVRVLETFRPLAASPIPLQPPRE